MVEENRSKKTKGLTPNALAALTAQSRWIIERKEGANEGIRSRTASLAGFAGVELSLIGAMVVTLGSSPSSAPRKCYIVFLFALISFTSILLLLSIYWLLKALAPFKSSKELDIDSVNRLVEYFKNNEWEFDSTKVEVSVEDWILSQLLMPHAPGSSYARILEEENSERSGRYGRGRTFLVVAQAFLVVSILVSYWRQ